MDFNMTLDALGLDQDAQIAQVTGTGPFRRRLLELGLLPGTAIRRTGQAPMGDPLQFQVRGAVLCIRRTEAATVRIERP